MVRTSVYTLTFFFAAQVSYTQLHWTLRMWGTRFSPWCVWILQRSGMRLCVVWYIGINVQKKPAPSISGYKIKPRGKRICWYRKTRIGTGWGTCCKWLPCSRDSCHPFLVSIRSSSRVARSSTLKMETGRSSNTFLPINKVLRRHIWEYRNLQCIETLRNMSTVLKIWAPIHYFRNQKKRKSLGAKIRLELGRTIAQAVSRQLPTAEARVQTRVWPCGILWWTIVALG
jgi:hypothetical protein